MPNENDPPRERPWDRSEPDGDHGDRPRRDRDDYDDDRPPRREDGPRDEPPNGLATAGFVLGLLALCTGPLAGIPAVICGAIALGRPGGRAFAVVGLVLGGFATLLSIPLAIGLLLPAVSKVRDAAARQKDMNNLKQIGIAMHGVHDTTGKLPAAQEKLSWRVYLLPYIEQGALAQQFDLREPWDSTANKRLANQQVPQYLSLSDPPQAVDTHYRVFVGPNTLYPQSQARFTLGAVPDGTANTFFAVEATEAVPWPQPKELQYDQHGPLPSLGFPHRRGFLVVMLDGSVRFVSERTSPDMLRRAIEPADGNPVSLE